MALGSSKREFPAIESVKGGPLNDLIWGLRPFIVLRLANDVADEETITFGGEVYEWDRADDGVDTIGAIPITTHADDTAANAAPAFAAAFNANTKTPYVAYSLGSGKVSVVRKTAGVPEAVTVEEEMEGVNNGWVGTAVKHGVEPTAGPFIRTVDADDITLNEVRIYVDERIPKLNFLPYNILTTTSTIKTDYNGVVTLNAARKEILFDNSGTNDLALNMRIVFKVS